MTNQYVEIMKPDDLSVFREGNQLIVALYDGKERTLKVKLPNSLSYRLFLHLQNFDKLIDIEHAGS